MRTCGCYRPCFCHEFEPRPAASPARVDLADPAGPPAVAIDGAFVDLGPMPAFDDPSAPDPLADLVAEVWT